MKALHDLLEAMRLPNGAYVASPSSDYSYVWIRDIAYTVLPYLHSDCGRYEAAYHALLDLFRQYEWKIDIHTRQKPVLPYEYIHARYSVDLREVPDPWGHAQNDSIGLFLWGLGEGVRHGKPLIRDSRDHDIVQKLVYYLGCLQYWQEPDNGIWEENVEVHASSVGACVAGLKAVSLLVNVPPEWIQKGEETLKNLLPRESVSKDTDLALLSLIYPYRVVNRATALRILGDITQKLERTHGVIRYQGDRYYNEGSEAQWCFGFPWLGLCYASLGDRQKVEHYWAKTTALLHANHGKLPELYIGGTLQPNQNNPLAWGVSMTLLLSEHVQPLSTTPTQYAKKGTSA
ncbi:glycoside hydrolase family 15 [Tumebacillus sp. ITR2]|uniref:Glycoside hydrolase family 15 n=1 Tax=Tumebacillus amylolyticus TaxID=2801339 RepID=A0ABS1J7F2_9BACL|nr:glycoside hydrolase family 15 protein [Tumebacillus amylolyticus]MBL0386211.1 glycoside hydrolase family 15 [Tumebacillus amylolyticus]